MPAWRAAAHRAWLRAQGLRPGRVWVPDRRAPGFDAAAHAQSAAVAASAHEQTDQDFVDALSRDVDDLGE